MRRRRTEIQTRPKLRARAKVRKEASVRQKELEENPTPLETRQSDAKRIGRVKTIDTGELKNVIAATIERVYLEEYGIAVDRTNAREHYAHLIMMTMKYGRFDEDGYLKLDDPIPMRDHDFGRPPLCKEHK